MDPVKSLFYLTYVAYIAAALVDLFHLGATQQPSRRFARRAVLGAVGLHTLALALALAYGGANALVSPFGAILVFTWAIVVVMLLVRFRFDVVMQEPVLLTVVVALLTLDHALSPGPSSPLSPAYAAGLGAGVFTVHIVAIFLGYAAFANSFAIAASYLVLDRALKQRRTMLLENCPVSLNLLDRANGWLLLLGVGALLMGILVGAVAMLTIDRTLHGLPKLVLTVVILLLYAALAFARRAKWLVGKRMAWASVAALGVIVVSFYFVR